MAKAFYKDVEGLFNQKFVYEAPVFRVIPNVDIFEQWQSNFLQAVAEGWIRSELVELQVEGFKTKSCMVINHSFWVDTLSFLKAVHNHFINKNQLIETTFQVSNFTITPKFINYKNKYQAEKIIFCEGAGAITNSFFNYLPFNLNKGEIIDAEIPNVCFDKVLKQNVFLFKNTKGSYTVGATYNRKYSNDLPGMEGRNYLEERLTRFLNVPF